MSAKGPELEVGATIPGTKYRVVKSLGAGGMGVVYQVVKPPNIQGVLKLMSSELTEHQEHRVRFFDEVRILAQLDHPNIVKVFDYDALPDGTPFYVMELLSGRTVRDVLHTLGRVPPRIAYEITRQLLEALQAAHTHEVPVIHRDIKPENIFLHAPRHGDPLVKLIDFGVSSVADRTHDNTFVGTWSYAAPEQIRGEKPTPATDLYAAGLVLYELLAGVGPFDHYDDWMKVSKAQLEEIPAPVSTFAPWVPASIVALIESALAKDPRKRPRDAYAFSERLFELEYASNGRDPYDMTSEGPPPDAVTPRVPPTRKHEAPREIHGDGPLSRVLSSIAHPSSKKLAAAKPAGDRLGDVPLIGVPPELIRVGPTFPGMGDGGAESDAAALLAGLDAKPNKPIKTPPKSDPDIGGITPRAGQVVIKPGRDASAMSEQVAPTTPRHAVTLDEIVPGTAAAGSPSARDTFWSQQSDAQRTSPRSRTGLFVLAAALLVGGATAAALVLLRGGKVPATAASVNTTTAASTTSTIAVSAPVTPPATPPQSAATTSPPAPSPEPATTATTSTGGSKRATPSSTKPPRPVPPAASSSNGELIRAF